MTPPKSEPLIQRILDLDQQGLLSDEALSALHQTCDNISHGIRHKTESVLQNRKPWEEFGLPEKLYNSVKPDEWKLLQYLLLEQPRIVSAHEMAEVLFQVQDSTLQQRQKVESLIRSMQIGLALNSASLRPERTFKHAMYKGEDAHGYFVFNKKSATT